MPEKNMNRGRAILQGCRYWLLAGPGERWYGQRALHAGGGEQPGAGVRGDRGTGGEEELLLPLPLIRRAKGPYLYDYDNNRYTDLCLGGGTLILGSAHPRITTAVKGWIGRGHAPCYPAAGHQLLSSLLDREVLRQPGNPGSEPGKENVASGWKADFFIFLDTPFQAWPALAALLRVMGRSQVGAAVRGHGAPAPLLDAWGTGAGRDPAETGYGNREGSPACSVVRLDGTEGPGLEEELRSLRGTGAPIVSDELLFPGYVHLISRPSLLGVVDVRLLGSWIAGGLSFACVAVRWPENAPHPPANVRALEELLNRWHPPLFTLKGAVQALNQVNKSGGMGELIRRHRVLADLLEGRAAGERDGIPYLVRYGPGIRNGLLERGIYGPLHRSHPLSVSLAHTPELLAKCAREINGLF